MGLVLTLHLGDGFLVNGVPVVLTKIMNADLFVLSHSSQDYEVGSDDWTRLMPGVQVRSTLPKDPTTHSNKVRVQVSAPEFEVYRFRRVEGEQDE